MFPRMLYRVLEDGKPLDFLGEVNDPDTRVVTTPAEFREAISEGWLCHPLRSEHEKEIGGLLEQTKPKAKPEPKPEPKSEPKESLVKQIKGKLKAKG